MIKPTNPKFIDLQGMNFGRLTVVEYMGKSGEKHQWLASCECGNKKVIRGSSLTGKMGTKSCGCVRAERVRDALTTHGRKKTSEYNTWRAMRSRCNNKKRPEYKNYGGRGIEVCKRWNESFEFFIFDMGEKPSPEYSLERIDNNKGYYPENCKWATALEQAANRRSKQEVKKDDEKATM